MPLFRKSDFPAWTNRAIEYGMRDVQEVPYKGADGKGAVAGYHIVGKDPDGNPVRIVSHTALEKWHNNLGSHKKSLAKEPKKPEKPISESRDSTPATPVALTPIEIPEIEFGFLRKDETVVIVGPWTGEMIASVILALSPEDRRKPLLMQISLEESNHTAFGKTRATAPAMSVDLSEVPGAILLRN